MSMMFLAAVSGVLCAIPAYSPVFLWWVNFIGYGLFFISVQKASTFSVCLIWSLCYVVLHSLSLFVAVADSCNSWWIFVGGMCIAVCMALPAALLLWFFLSSWIVALLVAHYYFVWCSLWFLGNVEGYWCLHPLVPWMSHPQILSWLPWWGVWGATLHFFVLVYLVFSLRWNVVVFCCMPWITGFLTDCPSARPALLDKVGVIQLPFYLQCNDIHARVEAFNKACDDLVTCNPSAHIIVSPESLFPLYLNKHDSVLTCIEKKGVRLFVGGYRIDNQEAYNSCYYFDGTAWSVYDKQHGVFFVERIPWFCFNCVICNSLLRGFLPFTCGVGSRPVCRVADIHLVPFLCSEVFMQDCIERASCSMTMCALINDAWFAQSSISDLLFYSVVLRARARKMAVLYVSYTRAIFIDAAGFCWPLCKSMVT